MHHDHDHRLAQDRRALTIALALLASIMVAEIVAGLVGHSLALLADAGHMLTDAAALVFALFASAMAARPAAGRWTYGYSRLEILAAQANGITLGLLAVWIVWSAIHRLVDPQSAERDTGISAGVAPGRVAIIAADVALRAVVADEQPAPTMAAAQEAGEQSLPLAHRAPHHHVAESGIAMRRAFVAALMLYSSAQLLRESTAIFLERAPEDVDPETIGRTLVEESGVVEVHDLHVWTVTSGFPALSAHVLVEPGADCHAARRRLEQTLADRFGLSHTTLQVDHAEPVTTRVALGDAVARHTPVEHR